MVLDRVLVLVALGVLGVVPALGWAAPRHLTITVAVAALLLAAVALRRGGAAAKPTTVLVAALTLLFPLGWLWPPTMAIALALFALVAWRRPEVRVQLPRGRVPWLVTLVAGAVTPLGLLGWVTLMHPDLHDVTREYVPHWPLAVLVLGGLLFAAVNATLEEVIWRGVFQDGLERTLGPGAAIAVQAVSFGAVHAHGVPRGVAGVVLAGSWALLLGWLRRCARGLLAPALSHFVADVTIAAIVFGWYR